MRLCGFLLSCVLLLSGAAHAQTAEAAWTPANVIPLIVGRGQLLQFTQDLVRVVVAEPKVAAPPRRSRGRR